MKTTFTISFSWDNEACVWIASSDDIPGLVLEHGSFDALIERVRFAIGDLLDLENSQYRDISLDYVTSRHEKLIAHG